MILIINCAQIANFILQLMCAILFRYTLKSFKKISNRKFLKSVKFMFLGCNGKSEFSVLIKQTEEKLKTYCGDCSIIWIDSIWIEWISWIEYWILLWLNNEQVQVTLWCQKEVTAEEMVNKKSYELGIMIFIKVYNHKFKYAVKCYLSQIWVFITYDMIYPQHPTYLAVLLSGLPDCHIRTDISWAYSIMTLYWTNFMMMPHSDKKVTPLGEEKIHVHYDNAPSHTSATAMVKMIKLHY